MNRAQTKKHDCSIIALDKFIQATRDSGYKGTPSAVSELVDNAIQAEACNIEIAVEAAGDDASIVVSILDDGCGMDPFTLRQALRFGGSTRFDDRTGLGRYGMGLPNSSLSQARRATVFTWQTIGNGKPLRNGSRLRSKSFTPERVYTSYLDVDEIVGGVMQEVPRPRVVKPLPQECRGASGTLVIWERCDRLDNRRVSTITRKLAAELGRRFRHFIWKGARIRINGRTVQAIDPLYLHADTHANGAQLFGEELRYEIRAELAETPNATGWVSVRFSELPVHKWSKLSNEDKRRLGISEGAGVSIVRGGREVDYGWFFMGGKRRENYDDWWRCEIQFDPVLDEAFGITHTKQQIRPKPYLLEALSLDLEAMARVLNARARKAHLAAKAGERFSKAEKLASERDHLLEPLPSKPNHKAKALMTELKKQHPVLRKKNGESNGSRYRIIEASVRDTSFFSFGVDGDQLVLVLNPQHPFYRELYKPLVEGESPQEQELRTKLELLLLAAARSEAACRSKTKGDTLAQQRIDWSNALATFLNG